MERSLFELNPPTRWVGRQLEIYAEVDSTNLVAERLARRGAPEGLLVVADAQTAGRGRLGRSFFSPAGLSLYMSLLLRPDGPPDRLPEHVFAAALAVADAASEVLPSSVQIEIKWPNDVLLGGRKTCGINLPAQLEGDRVASAVLGIGINVNLRREDFPHELRPIATSLLEAAGRRFDRVALAEAVLARLEKNIDQLRRGDFPSVLDAWQKYFRMRGERVRIGGPGCPTEIEGIVQGLDPAGALLVQSDRTLERILAGDVTLMPREA